MEAPLDAVCCAGALAALTGRRNVGVELNIPAGEPQDLPQLLGRAGGLSCKSRIFCSADRSWQCVHVPKQGLLRHADQPHLCWATPRHQVHVLHS